MEKLQQLVSEIGLEELINCTLIRANVRNAMLIQPADYGEAKSSDRKTTAKLRAIKAEFPELIQSNISGETLISKKPYKNENIKKSSNMGTILGYPCATGFNSIQAGKEITYAISINIELVPGYNNDSIQLIAYVCKDISTLDQSKRFAEKCAYVLKSDPLLGPIINTVRANIQKNMPISYLVDKLATNNPLSSDEKDEISNHIWNLGFPESKVSNYDYKYSNPVHRGILIGLLTLCDNNPMEAFYPLQKHPEHKESDKINGLWEKELVRIFELTEKRNNQRNTRRT